MPFTARIERALFHRARSASKKGTWPLLLPSFRACFSYLARVAWIGPSPRASREHNLIVRTLRAKGTIHAALPLP